MSLMMQKILIVDDDPEMQSIIRHYLTAEGFKVISVANGFDALKIVKENCPDLVLLDMLMSGMDEFGTLGKLREFSKVPVIILSSLDNEVDRLVGSYMGVDDYQTKPINATELIRCIKNVLDRAASGKLERKKVL